MDAFHEKIQHKIIEEFKLRIEQSINKDEFYAIYNRTKELYEQDGKEETLSLLEFAKEYLGLTVSAYKAVKGGYQNAKILKNYIVEEKDIQELRKRIIYEEKLHSGDLKSYRELLEYYNKYFIPLVEKDFFEKIFDIGDSTFKRIKPKKREESSIDNGVEKKEVKAEIIRNVVITEQEIEQLRNEVLSGELLHKDDTISYKKFLEIYKKYFIPLSEEDFAEQILDINKKNYTTIKFYPDKTTKILTKVKIPANIEEIRESIIRKERLHRKDKISYNRFNKILDNNYLPISRKDYSDLILDISESTLRSAKFDEERKIGILSRQKYPSKEEIEDIRKNIIKTYKLHKGDKITYNKFLNIYNDKRFYISLSEEEFAREILDIEIDMYQAIKYDTRDDTSILKNEIVSQEEIDELSKEILKEFKVGQKIDYDELLYIYNKYYIRLSIKEYANRVLNIKSIKDLKNKKYIVQDSNNPEKTKVKKMKTMIFLGVELEKLKNNIVVSNNLYNDMEITRQYFMKLYQSYSHAMSYMMFGKLVLGIDMYDTNALILGRNRKVRVSTNLPYDVNKMNRERFIKNQDDRIEELLYEGKLPDEIANQLMISQYDIDEKVDSILLSRNIKGELIEKARVKRKLFSDTKLYKIAIQLHMSIEDVKKISRIVISEEIHRYMSEDKLTFEEATNEILEELLSIRDKKISKQEVVSEGVKETKTRKILIAKIKKLSSEYEGKPKQKKSLEECVEFFKKDIQQGKFDKENINYLEQAILFLDKDYENIEVFIRYCIKQEEYKRANGFIAYYLNDYSINEKEKEKLRILHQEIKSAWKKSDAIKLIVNSNNSSNEKIARNTGNGITDIIALKREVETNALDRIIKELI